MFYTCVSHGVLHPKQWSSNMLVLYLLFVRLGTVLIGIFSCVIWPVLTTELGNFLGEQKWSLKMTILHFCLQLSIFITLIHIWVLHISPSWRLLFILSVFDWHCHKEGKIAQMLRAWIWVPCVRPNSYLSGAVPVKGLFCV